MLIIIPLKISIKGKNALIYAQEFEAHWDMNVWSFGFDIITWAFVCKICSDNILQNKPDMLSALHIFWQEMEGKKDVWVGMEEFQNLSPSGMDLLGCFHLTDMGRFFLCLWAGNEFKPCRHLQQTGSIHGAVVQRPWSQAMCGCCQINGHFTRYTGRYSAQMTQERLSIVMLSNAPENLIPKRVLGREKKQMNRASIVPVWNSFAPSVTLEWHPDLSIMAADDDSRMNPALEIHTLIYCNFHPWQKSNIHIHGWLWNCWQYISLSIVDRYSSV